jgi:tetratricopeptide (TPR) repeat protein
MNPIQLLDSGEAALRAGRPAAALPLLSKALRRAQDPFFQGDVLLRRAEALRALSRFRPALADCVEAAELYRRCGARGESLRAVLGASACLRVLSRYQDADALWRSAEALLPKPGRPADPSFEEVRLETALVLRGLGKHAEAASVLKSLIPRLNARRDGEALQHAWWALAGAERFGGRFRPALAAFGRAADLARRNGDRSAEAYAWCGEAACLRILGEGLLSFQTYRRAHRRFTAEEDVFGEAYGLCGMGNALRVCGDPAAALPLYDRSARLYQKVGDRGSRAFALWGLGGAHRRLGDHALALARYRAALKDFTAVGDRRGEVLALIGLGRTENDRGKRALARPALEKALVAARKEGLAFEAALALMELERMSIRFSPARLFRPFGLPPAAVSAWKDLP